MCATPFYSSLKRPSGERCCQESSDLNYERFPDIASGVRTLAHVYDLFLIDLWGVIHDGVRLYAHSSSTLQQLRTARKHIVFLTNSSRRSEEVKILLDRLGLSRDLYDSVWSSGELAFHLLTARRSFFHGKRCLLLGTQPESTWTNEIPVQFVNDSTEADFLLAIGVLPGGAAIHEYAASLSIARERKIPLICANPDVYVSIGTVSRLAAGALAQLYRSLGGRTLLLGKPYNLIYKSALSEFIHIEKTKTIAIGDSVNTDILGANLFGIASALVGTTESNNLRLVASYQTGSFHPLESAFSPMTTLRSFAW